MHLWLDQHDAWCDQHDVCGDPNTVSWPTQCTVSCGGLGRPGSPGVGGWFLKSVSDYDVILF